jgi:hypothetical protein
MLFWSSPRFDDEILVKSVLALSEEPLYYVLNSVPYEIGSLAHGKNVAGTVQAITKDKGSCELVG